MADEYQRKYLPWDEVRNCFVCERDTIFEAAALSKLSLWLLAIGRVGTEPEGEPGALYVSLLPHDAATFRTHSQVLVSRFRLPDETIKIIDPAQQVGDGELFVLASQASAVFAPREPPVPIVTSPRADSADNPLGKKEKENLLRTIGALVLFSTEGRSELKHGGQPNAKELANQVLALLEKHSLRVYGLQSRSLEERFAKGVQMVKRL